MASVKQTLKKMTPEPLWQFASDRYWGWHNRDRHLIARVFSPVWMNNKQRLESWRDTLAICF